MPGKPETVEVKVVYKPGQTPNVELVSPLMKSDVLTFKNNGHDGFWVKFILDDRSLAGYRFVSRAMSPMFSAVATDGTNPCPTGGEWPGFKVHDVTERTLTVRNKNGALPEGKTEERFGFTLRVTKNPAGNGPVIDLDPTGSNQNGPVFRAYSSTVVFVAGAVLGSLLTIGAEALFFR